MAKENRDPKSDRPPRGGPALGSQSGVQTPFAIRHSSFQHYTFVDYATQGYLVLVGLIVLCLHGRSVPHWPLLLAAHAVCIALIHALIRFGAARPDNRVLDFLRHFYPVLLYAGLYRETGELNHMLDPGFFDAFFIRLEARVFGLQPSLALMDRLPYQPVSELFYAAYFSYYLMIGGVGLALFYRNREQFFHYVSVISFVFYVCYLIYIFLPVMGPRIFFHEITDFQLPADVQPVLPPIFPEAVKAGLFYRIMAGIYHTFESPGAAFPSSHVAIAIATVWFSFLYLRPIRWPHLAVVILLCVATIYCRYHYAVDVVAGAVTAAVLIPLGNRLYFKFRKAGGPESPLLTGSR
jgi:membrane-associated phospholipid phosphatase